MVVENTWSRVKIKSKLPNQRIIHELRGIIVNKDQIHSELAKFFMLSSNLIKSDDKSVIEIRQFDILRKRTRRRIHGIKNQ